MSENNLKTEKSLKIGVIILMVVLIIFFAGVWISSESSSSSASSHACCICGKTEGTRQITAKTSSGRYDYNWYCQKHYADAWQYYYGGQ